MRTVGKGTFVGLTTATLIALGSFAAHAEDSSTASRVESYLIEADIETDGSLTVTESITFAPGSAAPAIFETELATWRIPDAPERIQVRDVDVDTSDHDRLRLSATYTIVGAFRAFTDGELAEGNPLGLSAGDGELFAEVIGPFADLAIAQARVEVRTPGAALAAACFVDGRSIPVCTDRIGDDQTTFRALDIPPRASMTIALVIDGSTVSLPAENEPPPNSEGVLGLLGSPWLFAIIIAAAVALAAIALAIRSRRAQG